MKRYSLIQRVAIVLALTAVGVLFGRDIIASAALAQADSSIRVHNYNGALPYVRRALWFDSSNPQAAVRLGHIAQMLRRRDFLEQAVTVESNAMLRRHDNVLPMVYADNLAELHQYEASASVWASLANASSTDGSESDLYVLWAAEMSSKAGNCEQAFSYFERHLKINPRDKKARNLIRDLKCTK